MPYKDRQKQLEYWKQYNKTHKKHRLKLNQEWRKRNPDKVKGYTKKWSLKKRIYDRKYRSYNKDKLFQILGGKTCIWCGYKDERALQFDHIRDDGFKDRERFSHPTKLYKYYIEHQDEARDNLQILCANCNWIKKELREEFRDMEFIEKHPDFFKDS